MLSILLVEDNPQKAAAIKACLIAEWPKASISTASTVALAHLLLSKEKSFSGVILDMSFQENYGVGRELDKPALAGLEVLQAISRKRLSAPVIVATQHTSFQSMDYGDVSSPSELDELLLEAFPENYRGLISIDLAEETWKQSLLAKAREHFSEK